MSDSLSVVMPAIGGITYLAYKHPKAYRRIFLILVLVSCVVLFGALVWNAGVNVTFMELLDTVRADSVLAAREKIRSMRIPSGYCFAGTGWLFYLLFLKQLPELLKEECRLEIPW